MAQVFMSRSQCQDHIRCRASLASRATLTDCQPTSLIHDDVRLLKQLRLSTCHSMRRGSQHFMCHFAHVLVFSQSIAFSRDPCQTRLSLPINRLRQARSRSFEHCSTITTTGRVCNARSRWATTCGASAHFSSHFRIFAAMQPGHKQIKDSLQTFALSTRRTRPLQLSEQDDHRSLQPVSGRTYCDTLWQAAGYNAAGTDQDELQPPFGVLGCCNSHG